MRIEPAGNRILVQRDELEDHDPNFKTAKAAGIVIPETEDQKRRQAGMDRGRVVALGETAYKDEFYQGIPWCKEGDYVLFAKYQGKAVTNHVTGENYLLINDADVLAVLKDYNG